MTKQVKDYIQKKISYYTQIPATRYKGVKGKAWTILSCYVRCRDFYRFNGACVSSGRRLAHWRDGDAGHYVSMGGHGAYLGFLDLNIHLQGKNENQIGSVDTGARFRDTLMKRYGGALLAQLELGKQRTVKADDWFFIEIIENMHQKFLLLKEEFPNAELPKYI